jgi:hypothetical protein
VGFEPYLTQIWVPLIRRYYHVGGQGLVGCNKLVYVVPPASQLNTIRGRMDDDYISMSGVKADHDV